MPGGLVRGVPPPEQRRSVNLPVTKNTTLRSSNTTGDLAGETFERSKMTLSDRSMGQDRVTIRDYERRLAEIDRLLNDPELSFDPAQVWALLADLAEDPPSSADE
jgi:hypothetical protein